MSPTRGHGVAQRNRSIGASVSLILLRVGVALVAIDGGLRRLRLLNRRDGFLTAAATSVELCLEFPDLLDLPFLLRLPHRLVFFRLGRLGEGLFRFVSRLGRRRLLQCLQLRKSPYDDIVQLSQGILGELINVQL